MPTPTPTPQSILRLALAAACALAVALITGCATSTGPAADKAPLAPGQLLEVARSDSYQWTGVAASKSGRIFVSYPRWNDPMRWSVAEIRPDGGGGTAVPYPNAGWQSWSPGVAQSLEKKWVCVQSVYVDATDRLWVLDPGSPRFEGPVPGAPKLVWFNLKTNEPVRTYMFDETVAPKGSYLNDVRIDTSNETAFISDSGLGAIVVLDLTTGKATRKLEGHPSTKAEPGVTLTIEGRELRFPDGPNAGQLPQIHCDGIALSPDRRWLYYQPITGRTLYRVPTGALHHPTMTPDEVATRVENLGPSVVTDGMIMDERGNLYLSALEHDAVVVRHPDGTTETLVHDPALSWPDTFTLAPDGTMLVTAAQIHRTKLFTGNPGPLPEPYRVFAFRRAQ